MKLAIMGKKVNVIFFLSLGINVVFTENDNECREKLYDLLKNGFGLIYVTEDFAKTLLDEIDSLQKKYNATIIFIPGGKNLNLGSKILNIYAERATGSTVCLND